MPATRWTSQGRILLECDKEAEEAAHKGHTRPIRRREARAWRIILKGKAGKLNRKLGIMKADA
ncbi:hypothetical protein DS837_30705 [Azospirillum brasilense]|uniref:Uncharacterized protein n=1 Tax=Azospirillum brasilense TaxID=192 RepID=A0A6L3ARG1_AZOBR|nr:hypothetical protein DS837_30705 [Azospirillum brasilense]